MRQPAKPKPQAFEEVARVLNVYRMLVEEMVRVQDPTGAVTAAILTVAERIAARTEG
jgi:hypothetical protein